HCVQAGGQQADDDNDDDDDHNNDDDDCFSQLLATTCFSGSGSSKGYCQGKSDQALAEFKPSSGCCKAACAFGAAGCLCKQSVVDMTNLVMKVDSSMAKQFSSPAAQAGCRLAYQRLNTQAHGAVHFTRAEEPGRTCAVGPGGRLWRDRPTGSEPSSGPLPTAGLQRAASGLPGRRLAGTCVRSSRSLSSQPLIEMYAGTKLQSACSAEIAAATAGFGGTTDAAALANISQADVDKYLATAKPPTPACCNAACAFNANLCSCDANMLGLVASFTGGKTDLYSSSESPDTQPAAEPGKAMLHPGQPATFATAFAQACNFKPYVSSTCPPKTPAPSTPYGTKCPA
ncbi:hypothetical protein QJQ45_016843, partial [Haematococcus lacustris]